MGLFDLHNSSSNHTCPGPKNADGPTIQPVVGSFTAHGLFVIVSGATALFAGLLTIFLLIRHATHYSCPREQKQIIRIITIVPSFAIVSFLCVWLDGSPNLYIAPGRDVGEAFPMAAFFLLMTAYIAPNEQSQDDCFAQLALLDKKGNELGGGSLVWFHKLAFMVVQWLPISIILWIATAISLAVGTYCVDSNSIHFAHIWITILRMISTGLAIIAILRFYTRSKPLLKSRGTLKQLICFKAIVFLNFVQTFIFSFLRSSGALHPSKYFTLNDLSNGLPSLILCCEMAPIALFFFVAYPVKPYSRKGDQWYHGGPLGCYAILQALNPVDIVIELLQGVRAKFHRDGGYTSVVAPHASYDGPGYAEPPQYGQYANHEYEMRNEQTPRVKAHHNGQY
ncbi:hypothetical protein NA57DRAFT_82054 [Rhizodiscina lignyota]|uniref:DUF300-domain-containing protein n=1 Tax=Rhizodiscina lignyota TaxID=1504668 RepID=A0A9P4I0H1_9PEZI|nr:hypothetical protein NA57DRAFT_82054 [Rhizodiscina lignyota]